MPIFLGVSRDRGHCGGGCPTQLYIVYFRKLGVTVLVHSIPLQLVQHFYTFCTYTYRQHSLQWFRKFFANILETKVGRLLCVGIRKSFPKYCPL